MNPGFSAVENPQNAGNQPMRIQDSFPPISDLSEPKKNTLKSNSFDVFKTFFFPFTCTFCLVL